MSTIGKRIKLERERLGLTQTVFGKAGGVKKLSQLGYETNKRPPDANYLVGIAEIGADIQYILFGKRTNTKIESDLLALKQLVEVPVFNINELGLESIENNKYYLSYLLSKDLFVNIGVNPDDVTMSVIHGFSMSPYLNDKDIVFIDTSVKEVIGERTFAIMLGGALLIKNLQVLSGNTIRAWAFSNEYPNITINKESDDVEIIGMVVACFRQF